MMAIYSNTKGYITADDKEKGGDLCQGVDEVLRNENIEKWDLEKRICSKIKRATYRISNSFNCPQSDPSTFPQYDFYIHPKCY